MADHVSGSWHCFFCSREYNIELDRCPDCGKKSRQNFSRTAGVWREPLAKRFNHHAPVSLVPPRPCEGVPDPVCVGHGRFVSNPSSWVDALTGRLGVVAYHMGACVRAVLVWDTYAAQSASLSVQFELDQVATLAGWALDEYEGKESGDVIVGPSGP